nr:splicing factor [Tanacetum cinerariifolium]
MKPRRDDTKKSMEDEHMQGLLVEQENLRQKQEKEQQDNLDEEALQQAREEDLMFKIMDLEREREEQQ